MSSPSQLASATQRSGAQALVESLLRCGINCAFGIPSIHNIPIYECLRQTPQFHHRVVRHEQAAGFAADGFYRHSGRPAAILASTGPGNLFTLVPLLESLQSNTPVLLIGTNIASPLQTRSGGALHETPEQIEIVRPLTRYARRVSSPEEIPRAVAEAADVLYGNLPGPAFIEVPHDLLAAAVSAQFPGSKKGQTGSIGDRENTQAAALVQQSHKPVILIGGGVRESAAAVCHLAEMLQAPVFTTTSGKGQFADDHPLAMGCISRLGTVQEIFGQSGLLISFAARLTEFDTGRFGLVLPENHIQVVEDAAYSGNRITPKLQLVGKIRAAAAMLAQGLEPRGPWCDIAALMAAEKAKLESLKADGYSALSLLRGALRRDDVVVNDQSILNYWASAFFPVLAPGTFIYPYGSGTLGYGLPAAIGAAFAVRESGGKERVICIAGDGGFQYTQHELATLAQYDLPVKILLVNDNAYGVIGFLQRSLFGHTHEVALKNPDFCKVAKAYGVGGRCVKTLGELKQNIGSWLETPGPALLEWQTELKAPWEVGAILRPTGISANSEK